MALIQVIDPKTGDVLIMDDTHIISRRKQLPLEHKIKIVKHFIMTFLARVNRDLDPDEEIEYLSGKEYKTIKQLSLFDLRKWMSKIEEGWSDKYVRKYLGTIDKNYISNKG